jgi:hypothetical protein
MWRNPDTEQDKLRYKKNIDTPEISGVYRITSKTTGSFYIGAAMNIHARIRGHLLALQKSRTRHPFEVEYHKYGLDDLVIDVLEPCDTLELSDRELDWLIRFLSIPENRNKCKNKMLPARHRMWRGE